MTNKVADIDQNYDSAYGITRDALQSTYLIIFLTDQPIHQPAHQKYQQTKPYESFPGESLLRLFAEFTI